MAMSSPPVPVGSVSSSSNPPPAAPNDPKIATWQDFLSKVGRAEGDVKDWSNDALKEALAEKGFKGVERGDVESYWKSLQGWQRDLLCECVEPNPGPSWEEVREALEKKLGKRAPVHKAQLDAFETALYNAFPLANEKDIHEFIARDKAAFENKFSGVSENMLGFINEIIPPASTDPSANPSSDVSRDQKRRKIDMLDIALTELDVKFADKLSKIQYYIMSGSTLSESLDKLENLAAPLVPPAQIFAKQKAQVPWLEIAYPCKTHTHEFADMKFLPDLTATSEDICGTFDKFIVNAVSTEVRNAQDNKFITVPACTGSGKTTLAFLMSRLRYVVFADVSVDTGSFAIVCNIAVSFQSAVESIVKRYPECEFSLRVRYNQVITAAIKLFVAVHLKLVSEFHKKYHDHPKRHELFLRFLLNGGKFYPNIWMHAHMRKILVTTGETVTHFYNYVVGDMALEARLATHDVLFFVDELPNLGYVLPGAFMRQKYLLRPLSSPEQQAALTDPNPTSLLYIVRQVFLTIVCDSQFPIPMVGAGTDVEMAVQQEILPSPYTRDNLVAYTKLVHVTVQHIVYNLNTCVSSTILETDIDAFGWKWAGRILWYAEYFLGVLWGDELIKQESTPLSAVKAASKIGFLRAVDKARRMAKDFIVGTQTYNVSGKIMSARSLMQMVFYALTMRGGKLELPNEVVWDLIDKGLVHVHETLRVPIFSESQPEEDSNSIETQAVTIAEPIMQAGIRQAFNAIAAEGVLTKDPILSLLSDQMFNVSHLLGKGLSYHGNFGERVVARLLQIAKPGNSKRCPISYLRGFEYLKGTVFDFYVLSVECFGSPEDFGMSDVDALCSLDQHKGFFQGNYAGPDIKVVLKKMPVEELSPILAVIDKNLHKKCPTVVPATVQCKCRKSTTGIGALKSLDPAFFYKVRKVRKTQELAEDDDDSSDEAELEKQSSDASKDFGSWLQSNSGVYDVYLRIIYSHSSFGEDFMKQYKEYCRSPIARLRPIVLLDAGWLDEKNKILFENICGVLETPLSPSEDLELIASLEKDEQWRSGAATKDVLRSLGLYLAGNASELRGHLSAWLCWDNDPVKDLDIGLPVVHNDLLRQAGLQPKPRQ